MSITRLPLWRLALAAACATAADYATRAAVLLDGSLTRDEVRAALAKPAERPQLHIVDSAPELRAAIDARVVAALYRRRLTS